MIFTKLATSVVGPHDDVEMHDQAARQVDYEGELAVVIGRSGRNIPEQDAMGYVWRGDEVRVSIDGLGSIRNVFR